ncbi:MAG: protoporphyrinogen oxidase HemJ [Alphaproteobacteria bacterium]|nr:protoporphyrinogen oxidase HemJ [Alphaproteobacteria bacterium]
MLWFKALHLIAAFAWMAGLFYLPRLLVYHAEEETGSKSSELFKVMERRLLRAIMTPAAIATWAFGLLTVWAGGYLEVFPGWLLVKILSLVALTLVHLWLAREVGHFAADQRAHTHRFYRMVNEIPTVLLIIIVTMVVLRPNF